MAAENNGDVGEIAGINFDNAGQFDALGRPVGISQQSNAGNAADIANSGGSTSDGNAATEPERIGGTRVFDPAGDGDDSGDGNSGQWGFRADGTPRKKPGRRPGAGNSSAQRKPSAAKPTAKSSKEAVSGIEKILFSVHAIAAVKTNCPELALDQKEANMLASALNAVQEHYGVEIPPEYAIWVNLVTACGMIYGPRIVQISSRKKRERKEKEPPRSPYSEPQKQPPASEPPMPLTMTLPGMHSPMN